MTTQFEEDDYLKIKLLSYDRPDELTERYYFLEMSTLQATTLLSRDKKILSCKIVAYTPDNRYLENEIVSSFKTVAHFNDFFIKNPEYDLHNCEIEFEGGVILNSHDDGEVSIKFELGNIDQIFLSRICEKYKLDKSLMEMLKGKPGRCIAVDGNSITGEFENFDNYLRSGRD
jgi:hypothetical protein